VLLQPFPGTVDFEKWEKTQTDPLTIDDIPRDASLADSLVAAAEGVHAASADDAAQIREGTQGAWDRFYSLPQIWKRATA
jgi:hypothetical protein